MSEKSVVRKNAVRSEVRTERCSAEWVRGGANDLVTRQAVTGDVTAERAVSERAKDDAHQGHPVTKPAVTTSVTTERAWSGRLSSEAKVKRAAKILASHQKQLDRVRALARQLLRELEDPHA